MRRARYLLRTTSLPVPAVAESCGYGLVQNFGRAFKQESGETPAAYRRRHRQGLSAASGAPAAV
jgi:transcriptional regulator GlxA family with amidase domain